MKTQNHASRRKFLHQIGASSLIAASSPFYSMAAGARADEGILRYEKQIKSSDRIRVGV